MAEADNLFAVFDDAPAALRAAIAMQRVCTEAAPRHAEHDRVAVAIGVGFGRILDIDGHDFFGHEVNLASKLGEDTASGGEILLTEAAHGRVAGELEHEAEPRCECEGLPKRVF